MLTNSASAQRGMTLISLMVGLLLSMISILAGMMLYKNLVQVSVESRTDAAQDGQLASAMLSLQLEVQTAGYGIASDEPGTHLQVVAGPPQTLYWRYKEGGAFVCRGFRIEDAAVDGYTRRQLQLLSLPAASCNASGVLSGLPNWAISSVVAEFRTSAAAPSLPAITLSAAEQECFPYGMGEADDHMMVTVSADNAARRAAVDAGTVAPNAPIVYNFCLPNL